MPRQSGPVVGTVLLLALTAGCLPTSEKCCCPTTLAPIVASPPPPLPAVARGHMESLFAGLPQLIPDEKLPGTAAEVVPLYYALTPHDCQCMAARCCVPANLMDRERIALQQQTGQKCLCLFKKKDLAGTAVQQDLLTSAALEARNLQAGAALELYYRLAMAEAAVDLLQASVVELENGVAKAKELRDKDLITDADFEKLQRQRFKSLQERTEMLMNIERLNVEMGKLMCLKVCPGEAHFWPLVDFDSTCQDIDVCAAAETAVAARGELKVLRSVQGSTTILTLDAARGVMRSINGLLNLAVPRSKIAEFQVFAECLCEEGPYTVELNARRDQMAMRVRQREEEIAADVREEAAQIKRRCQTASLARKRSDSLAKFVRDMEERNRKDLAPSSEVTRARVEWYQARGEVVQEVGAREIAKVKLRQHQGTLGQECLEPDPLPPEKRKCCK